MPYGSSSSIPQWAAKITCPKHTRVTTSSSVADSTNSQAGNSHDSVIIEDLDLSDLDISPSTLRTGSPSFPDDGATDEYAPYPDSVNNFFGEQTPAVISEACLMNDLYILVKVPTNPKRLVSTSTTASQTSLTSLNSSGLSSNLPLNSNHMIFPIQEEIQDHSVSESKSKIPVLIRPSSQQTHCWSRETSAFEEFPSTTSIIRYNNVVPLPNQVPEQPEELLLEINQKHVSTPPCQNEIELQEVNLNSARFSGHANISLENYGILITPTKTPRTENLLVFQVDTERRETNTEKDSSCFEWFTKFFRRKRRRNNGFVHAKVYKTYFVKWKKCNEATECTRCQSRTTTNARRNST